MFYKQEYIFANTKLSKLIIDYKTTRTVSRNHAHNYNG